jgi:hypothetical protein
MEPLQPTEEVERSESGEVTPSSSLPATPQPPHMKPPNENKRKQSQDMGMIEALSSIQRQRNEVQLQIAQDDLEFRRQKMKLEQKTEIIKAMISNNRPMEEIQAPEISGVVDEERRK